MVHSSRKKSASAEQEGRSYSGSPREHNTLSKGYLRRKSLSKPCKKKLTREGEKKKEAGYLFPNTKKKGRRRCRGPAIRKRGEKKKKRGGEKRSALTGSTGQREKKEPFRETCSRGKKKKKKEVHQKKKKGGYLISPIFGKSMISEIVRGGGGDEGGGRLISPKPRVRASQTGKKALGRK